MRMNKLKAIFIVKVADDRLSAELDYNEAYEEMEKIDITAADIINFLQAQNITFGIDKEKIEEIATNMSQVQFPVQIAKGIDRENGVDGEVKYKLDLNTEVDRSDGWNFREVMRIPTVKVGEKIAKIIPPTEGKNGKNIYGKTILARPGKPVRLRPGKNVKYNENEMTFYAAAEGQVSIGRRSLDIHTVYELHEDISMKTGNIDFSGTVVIRGDVPTGFTVKATGDIKVYGLVEAATIIAAGSVFISEGFAGQKKGTIHAGENVHIGYVNQGIISAGNDILVENSILHSECSAKQDIKCQKGNIIGGVISAGRTIYGKDIGNRMNTLTQLSFGSDKKLMDEQLELEEEKETLTNNLRKLNMLRDKLESDEGVKTTQNRVTLLKLKHSFNQTREKLAEVEKDLQEINANLGSIEHTSLKVTGTIYPNVVISFGKYKRTIDRNYDHVSIQIEKNEIAIKPY